MKLPRARLDATREPYKNRDAWNSDLKQLAAPVPSCFKPFFALQSGSCAHRSSVPIPARWAAGGRSRLTQAGVPCSRLTAGILDLGLIMTTRRLAVVLRGVSVSERVAIQKRGVQMCWFRCHATAMTLTEGSQNQVEVAGTYAR